MMFLPTLSRAPNDIQSCLGDVLVTKNPCLHPGDIRRLKAVNVSALRGSIRDCIVFPVKGRRPHPNEIAGSDLDGDQYWVYWGTELTIPKVVFPLSYAPVKKAEVREVTESVIFNHILQTAGNSIVGLICNTHSVMADKHLKGTFSPECERLTVLFSRAIDAVKTGEIIDTTEIRELQKKYCDKYPSWMDNGTKPTYQSDSINGYLVQEARNIKIPWSSYKYLLQSYPRTTNPPDRSVSIDIPEQNTSEQSQTSAPSERVMDYQYTHEKKFEAKPG